MTYQNQHLRKDPVPAKQCLDCHRLVVTGPRCASCAQLKKWADGEYAERPPWPPKS